MASTMLLVLPLQLRASPSSLANLMHRLIKSNNSKLLVHLVNRSKDSSTSRQLGLMTAKDVLRASIRVPTMDVQVLTRRCRADELDKIEDDVDHVFFDQSLAESEISHLLQKCLKPPVPPMESVAIEEDGHTKEILESFRVYEHVVMGGTFDRLHVGHKLLLTEALFRCEKSLTIGVTEGKMIEKKTLCELILPVERRIEELRSYLKSCDPGLELKLVPIEDPFGPSIIDEQLQCIVGSEETQKGCHKVNEKRAEKGMSQLDVVIIGVEDDPERDEEIEESKISSRSIRLRLLGTRLRPPLKPYDCSKPYVIGLTGGSASGKSSVAKRLQKLGAGVVDCDKLGHKAYEKGTECFRQVVQAFGSEILSSDGNIDRRVLGAKVFGSKDAKSQLESLVWPEIRRLAFLQVEHLFKNESKRVIVLDAAVLLAANWHRLLCNEVWVCFIGSDEAVKRIVERDNRSEEEAKSRIASQLRNEEVLKEAHVAFCTQWQESFTQKQVEKAWKIIPCNQCNENK